MQQDSHAFRIKRTIITSLVLAAFASLIYSLVQRWKQRSVAKPEQSARFKPREQGLSEAEAASRRTDVRDQARLLMQQRTRLERRRRNIFSIFNLTILALSVSQILLHDVLGATGTLATLVLNIAVNIYQETRAARQVEELANKARPMATVIRSGSLRSIDQDEVVIGDILVAGRGDEILEDGVLVESANLTMDESTLDEQGQSITKNPGDPLKTGTYFASGWAVYRVEQISIETSAGEKQIATALSAQSTTPLQIIVQRVLYVLLFFTGIFYLSIMTKVVRADILPPEVMAAYRDAMSIIFSIAPGGLFFMIVINYSVGSADIARSGALVRNSLTIESLAQVSTVCLIRRGGLTGVNIVIEMMPSTSDAPGLPENRARQLLGNYIQSIQGENLPLPVLKERLEGEQHAFDQQARYLSIYGWEAASFTSTDMPGSYVIGYPDVLKPYFIDQKPKKSKTNEADSGQDGQKGINSRLRKWLRRGTSKSKSAAEESVSDGATLANADSKLTIPRSEVDRSTAIIGDSRLPEIGTDTLAEPKSGGILKQFRTRLAGLVHRKSTKDQGVQKSAQDQPDEILRLMFAYSPSPRPIYNKNNQPHCPRELIPVCYIRFLEEIRPEVQTAIQTLLDAEVSIKILADDEPMRALALAQEVGLVKVETDEVPVVAGNEISQLTPDQLREAALDKSIFAPLTSDQMLRIIASLHEQGEYVAVMGSSTTDLPVMSQANLSITRQGSNPKVLDQANIILLKNSPNALPEVLQKGQRIVNGLMDVLKLNLTQIVYILILLIVKFAIGDRIFFYHPAQGGAIGLFTIVIPSIALSFWSSTVPIRRTSMHLQLVHFIVPAAVMTSLCVVVLNSVFLKANATITYNQVVITHLLVVFVQPPVRFMALDNDFRPDWRPTTIAVILFLIFQFSTRIPLAQHHLKLAPLATLQDYLTVWGCP